MLNFYRSTNAKLTTYALFSALLYTRAVYGRYLTAQCMYNNVMIRSDSASNKLNTFKLALVRQTIYVKRIIFCPILLLFGERKYENCLPCMLCLDQINLNS